MPEPSTKNGRRSAEERLERGEVDDGGIGFDLSEIGIDGAR